MSITTVVWPIISAVCKATVFLGADTNICHPVNPAQEAFLSAYVSKQSELKKFKDDELRTWATTDYQSLNKLLKDEGFSIQLDQCDFGVVSILNVLVKWLNLGEKTEITRRGIQYPAVKLGESHQVRLHSWERYEYVQSTLGFPSPKRPEQALCRQEVLEIPTQSGDTVWITIADWPTADGFVLLKHIDAIRRNLIDCPDANITAIFPMVDLDQKVDISWLSGMELGPKYVIDQAKQQTKLKVNEVGALVQSAVTLGIKAVCCKPERKIVIDRPFYLWIERPGVSHPIFAGCIKESDWKEPKNLETK